MGQIGQRLHSALKMAVCHLVDHQSQQKRENAVGNDVHQTHDHRVAQDDTNVRIAEELLEVMQSHEFAAQNTLGGAVLDECHQPAIQWAVVKDGNQNDTGDRHSEQDFLVLCLPQQGGAPERLLGLFLLPALA